MLRQQRGLLLAMAGCGSGRWRWGALQQLLRQQPRCTAAVTQHTAGVVGAAAFPPSVAVASWRQLVVRLEGRAVVGGVARQALPLLLPLRVLIQWLVLLVLELAVVLTMRRSRTGQPQRRRRILR